MLIMCDVLDADWLTGLSVRHTWYHDVIYQLIDTADSQGYRLSENLIDLLANGNRTIKFLLYDYCYHNEQIPFHANYFLLDEARTSFVNDTNSRPVAV